MKNNRVLIPPVRIEFVIFTEPSEPQPETGVNRVYLLGRHRSYEVVSESAGLFLLLARMAGIRGIIILSRSKAS